MKKSDLKDGMRVVLRNGESGTIADNCTKILSDICGAYFLRYYNEELTREDDEYDADIMAISVTNNLWERKEIIKEVTMKDIEEKFGCKVKIRG